MKRSTFMYLLGGILLVIAVGVFYVEYQDYRTLGESPRPMTIDAAIPPGGAGTDSARWVRLTDALEPDCTTVLDETSRGTVVGRRFLARDAGKQRWVYLRLHGEVPCGAPMAGLEGILKQVDPGLPAWLKDKGVNVPASSFPFMELSVGDGPESIKLLFSACAAIVALALIILIVAPFERRKEARR
jgi:hypothetical protein